MKICEIDREKEVAYNEFLFLMNSRSWQRTEYTVWNIESICFFQNHNLNKIYNILFQGPLPHSTVAEIRLPPLQSICICQGIIHQKPGWQSRKHYFPTFTKQSWLRVLLLKDTSVTTRTQTHYSADQKHQSLNSVLITNRFLQFSYVTVVII